MIEVFIDGHEKDAGWVSEVARALLERAGYCLECTVEARLRQYFEIFQEWNAYAGLMGNFCVERFREHVVDSFSLAPYVLNRDAVYVDVGSGGGFPAVPLLCLAPGTRCQMIERSEKKARVLARMVSALGLEASRVTEGDFRGAKLLDSPRVFTARAIERPERLAKELVGRMSEADEFLCQSVRGLESVAGKVHAELVEDEWTRRGLRRGVLYRVRKKG